MAQKTNGCGLISGAYMNDNRPITRDIWLQETFPEWGTYLNKEIANYKVEPKSFAMWWLGGASYVIKDSEQHVFVLDNYAGPSMYTDYAYCGVCRTGGAAQLEWLRCIPVFVDPWGFEKGDACVITHHHQDHCDIYTVKALTELSDCPFICPKFSAGKLEGYEVPKDRIKIVKPGDEIKFGRTTILALRNYDTMVTMTGAKKPGENMPFDDVAVSYLFQTDGGNVLFLGDTLFNNGYKTFAKYNIDVACMDMGYCAPGATDKMSPYDVFRVAVNVGAKVVIPNHYENWANSKEDPEMLHYIVDKKGDGKLHATTMEPGGCYVYPRDKDMRRYKYPDYAERYQPDLSWEYGDKPETWPVK